MNAEEKEKLKTYQEYSSFCKIEFWIMITASIVNIAISITRGIPLYGIIYGIIFAGLSLYFFRCSKKYQKLSKKIEEEK